MRVRSSTDALNMSSITVHARWHNYSLGWVSLPTHQLDDWVCIGICVLWLQILQWTYMLLMMLLRVCYTSESRKHIRQFTYRNKAYWTSKEPLKCLHRVTTTSYSIAWPQGVSNMIHANAAFGTHITIIDIPSSTPLLSCTIHAHRKWLIYFSPSSPDILIVARKRIAAWSMHKSSMHTHLNETKIRAVGFTSGLVPGPSVRLARQKGRQKSLAAASTSNREFWDRNHMGNTAF